MINEHSGRLTVSRGILRFSYNLESRSKWLFGDREEDLPDTSPFSFSRFSYQKLGASPQPNPSKPSRFWKRLGFNWTVHGEEESFFRVGIFPTQGPIDLIEQKTKLRVGFPLWLPGIVLTLASFIYLRQRRRGWVRWRRQTQRALPRLWVLTARHFY